PCLCTPRHRLLVLFNRTATPERYTLSLHDALPICAEEISDAQSPLAGWDRPSRKFASNGADPPPKWSDFADPLDAIGARFGRIRSEEHTSELQSLAYLVCRLLLEKKKKRNNDTLTY